MDQNTDKTKIVGPDGTTIAPADKPVGDQAQATGDDYSPEECARRSGEVEQHLEAISDTVPIKGSPDPEKQAAGKRYGKGTSVLIGLAADAVQRATDLFKKKGLTFDAAGLRSAEAKVRYLSENRDGVQSVADDLGGLVSEAKGDAVEMLDQVIEIARSLANDKMLSPKERQAALRLVKTLLAAVDALNQSVQNQKAGKQAIKEQGLSEAAKLRAQLARAKMENDVLRGKDISDGTEDAPPPAPKKGSRKKLH